MACFFAVLLLLVPGRALADDVLSTDGVVEDTTDDVAEVVTDTTDDVSDVVTDTTDEVTEVVTDTTDEVTEVVTNVDEATGALVGTVGGSPGSDANALPDGRSGGRSETNDRAGTLVIVSRGSDAGSRRWNPVNPLGLAPTDIASSGTGSPEEPDPCVEDPELVCLGVLFGQGEFGKLGAHVLGIVATTGIGLIGLMVIALGLGISGSGALVAGRHRSSGAVRGAG